MNAFKKAGDFNERLPQVPHRNLNASDSSSILIKAKDEAAVHSA